MNSQNYFGYVQTKNIKYSECVSVAFFIQHEKRKHRIALLAVA
jgi:hypothetical protein